MKAGEREERVMRRGSEEEGREREQTMKIMCLLNTKKRRSIGKKSAFCTLKFQNLLRFPLEKSAFCETSFSMFCKFYQKNVHFGSN